MHLTTSENNFLNIYGWIKKEKDKNHSKMICGLKQYPVPHVGLAIGF
jgi:hypothetical protein